MIQLEKQAVTFMTPSVNDDVYPPEDTYLELEIFDQELMKLGISTISSEKIASTMTWILSIQNVFLHH